MPNLPKQLLPKKRRRKSFNSSLGTILLHRSLLLVFSFKVDNYLFQRADKLLYIFSLGLRCFVWAIQSLHPNSCIYIAYRPWLSLYVFWNFVREKKIHSSSSRKKRDLLLLEWKRSEKIICNKTIPNHNKVLGIFIQLPFIPFLLYR